MRSKLNFLIGVSLKRKMKSKWFVIANLAIALVIIGIINIDSVINYFGGDFSKKPTIYVVDKANVYDVFNQNIDSTSISLGNKESQYIVTKTDESVENLKKKLDEDKEEASNIIIEFNPSNEKTLDVTMTTKEYMDLIDTQVITNAVNNTKVSLAIKNSSISEEELSKIYETIEINRVYLNEKQNSLDENMEMIMSTVFPIVILPFFMLTLFLVQMIGAEVNDEKTTRGMEIIISNVSPKTHFFSKIIAGNLFVIMQGILLFVYGALGLFIRSKIGGTDITGGIGSEVTNVISSLLSSSVGSKLIYIIPLTLALMLITFLAYSLLAGILASMTTNTEDFQQLQTPIIIISLVGYYLAMMAGMFEGAIFIKILAFVPLLSAILSPSLLVLGQFGIIEVVISILITLGFIFLLIKYGLKIYKVGILNYSSKDLWKKMFKAIKE